MKHYNSMVDPSINELKENMNNRYLLVNVTAQRAREIAEEAQNEDLSLESKPVTIALHEIADGDIEVVAADEAAVEVSGEAAEEVTEDVADEIIWSEDDGGENDYDGE